MKETEGLTITVGMNTDKLQLKLRAIAKHAEALAKELDEIDNAWQCDCGSTEFIDVHFNSKLIRRECEKCGEHYAVNNDELSIRPEVSD